jgi:UDP-N-acetyl-D-galactosamine dehydrogenase
MNIDTEEVLDAAGSKWNFLPFKPGLVGGHCIGVDPYYLTYKAESIGYHPKIILAGRELNDSMGNYVALELVKKMETKNIQIKGARILIMGLTFKENCPDIRNSGVKNVITELKKFECSLALQDPYVDREEIKKMYNIYPNLKQSQNMYDAVLISVAHKQFKKIGLTKIKNLCKKNHVIFDLKNLFNSDQVDLKL